MDTYHQPIPGRQLAQLSKTELKTLIYSSSTNIASVIDGSDNFRINGISRNLAKQECLRRARAYERVSQYSGIAIIACLAFIMLVQLLQ